MPPRTTHCVFSLTVAVARGSIYYPSCSYDDTFFGMVTEHFYGLSITNTFDYSLTATFFRLWMHYDRLWRLNQASSQPKKHPGKPFRLCAHAQFEKVLLPSDGIPNVRSFAALGLIIENLPYLVPQSNISPTLPLLWPDAYKLDRESARQAYTKWLSILEDPTLDKTEAEILVWEHRNALKSEYRLQIPVGTRPSTEQRDLWDRFDYEDARANGRLYFNNDAEEVEFEADFEQSVRDWEGLRAKVED